MKISLAAKLSSVLSGTGIISGSTFGEETTFLKTVEQVLGANSKEVLGQNRNSEGLVLAQKYREYKTVEKGKERDFSKQEDPGFLDKNYWEENIKKSTEDFSKDKEIASKLKSTCLEKIKENYTLELYKNVLEGCRYKIPDYAKEIFEFQNKQENCRLWLLMDTKNEKGKFVWEIIEDTHDGLENNFLLRLRENISAGDISMDCKAKHVFPLGYRKISNSERWKGTSIDYSGKIRKRF